VSQSSKKFSFCSGSSILTSRSSVCIRKTDQAISISLPATIRLISSDFLTLWRYIFENSIKSISHGFILFFMTSSKAMDTLRSNGSEDIGYMPSRISSTILTYFSSFWLLSFSASSIRERWNMRWLRIASHS
jgi:hypothetical protein